MNSKGSFSKRLFVTPKELFSLKVDDIPGAQPSRAPQYQRQASCLQIRDIEGARPKVAGTTKKVTHYEDLLRSRLINLDVGKLDYTPMIRREIGFDQDKRIFDRFPEKRHFGYFNGSEIEKQGILKGSKNDHTHVEIFDYPRTLWVKDIIGASPNPAKKWIKDRSLEPNKEQPLQPIRARRGINDNIHLREKGDRKNRSQIYTTTYGDYGAQQVAETQKFLNASREENKYFQAEVRRPSLNNQAQLRGGRISSELDNSLEASKGSYSRTVNASPQHPQIPEQSQLFKNHSHMHQIVNYNNGSSFEKIPRELPHIKSEERFSSKDFIPSYQQNTNLDGNNTRNTQHSPEPTNIQRSNSFIRGRELSEERNQRKQVVIYNIISNQPSMAVPYLRSDSPSRYEMSQNE